MLRSVTCLVSLVCLQLSSMQQVVREKDARFETQVRLHEDELLQLVTQADVETELQQVCCSNSIEWLSFWLLFNQDFTAICHSLPFPTALHPATVQSLASYGCPAFRCLSLLSPDLPFPSVPFFLISLELGTLKLSLRGDLGGLNSELASLSFAHLYLPFMC